MLKGTCINFCHAKSQSQEQYNCMKTKYDQAMAGSNSDKVSAAAPFCLRMTVLVLLQSFDSCWFNPSPGHLSMF